MASIDVNVAIIALNSVFRGVNNNRDLMMRTLAEK